MHLILTEPGGSPGPWTSGDVGRTERLSPQRRSPPCSVQAESVHVTATTDVLVAQVLGAGSASPARPPLHWFQSRPSPACGQAPADTHQLGWAVSIPVTTSCHPSVTPLVRHGGRGAGFHITCPAAWAASSTCLPASPCLHDLTCWTVTAKSVSWHRSLSTLSPRATRYVPSWCAVTSPSGPWINVTAKVSDSPAQ